MVQVIYNLFNDRHDASTHASCSGAAYCEGGAGVAGVRPGAPGAVRMGGKWRGSRRSNAPRGGEPASAAPSSDARSDSVDTRARRYTSWY